jgi:hypothetical protein
MVGGVMISLTKRFFYHLRQQLSYWHFVKKFSGRFKMVGGVNETADRWWVVSVTPLTTGGRYQ